MIRIDRALVIDGWMIESELKWLAEEARKRHNIVEVGAWMGRTTRALADNTPGVVYAVDTWKGSEEHQDELAKHEGWWLFDQFRRNTSDRGNIKPIQMASVEAAQYFRSTFPNMRFDMIFLDAAHDYENVKADILAWRPLLAEGGTFCGHDYGPGCHGVGVKKAVNELIPNVRVAQNEIWVAG